MREKVLRDLASRAATDAGFLKQARGDLEGTLARSGHDLTLEGSSPSLEPEREEASKVAPR